MVWISLIVVLFMVKRDNEWEWKKEQEEKSQGKAKQNNTNVHLLTALYYELKVNQ